MENYAEGVQKKWYQSRTLWLAIVQSALAILGIAVTHNPMLETIGVVAILKSVLDIFLRYLTTKEISM